MDYRISRVVVIGAGTMGAGIAAHLANAGTPVTLLDIVPQELTKSEIRQGLTLKDKVVRNRVVMEGLERVKKSRPASFMSSHYYPLVSTGNLEDDFACIEKADWVIEAIVENLAIKRDLMSRIDRARGEKTIISTNTSGIPVNQIAKGMSEGFRKHFLGTHFFNPPRYLKLLELIPSDDTRSEVIDAISHFGRVALGKGCVICKDTPNFIANRLGSVTGAFALDYALEHEYSVSEVDSIIGPVIGRPKTGLFRLFDLVGLDVSAHVRGNLVEAIPHDVMAVDVLNSERNNALISEMMKRGWLGNKTEIGFYKPVRSNGKKEFLPLNLKTLEHASESKVRFDSIGQAKDMETLREKLQVFMTTDDRASLLVQAITFQALSYASSLIPEIADTPVPIDHAVEWGFMHEAGPFEIWDMLGVPAMTERMKKAGYKPAQWVDDMVSSGCDHFYQIQNGQVVGVYHPGKKAYEPVSRETGIIILAEEKTKGKIISKNLGATLVDLGDGVACLEFHTKMNAIDEDIMRMMAEALDRTERDFEGLVIGNQGENFSAGANLFAIVLGAQQGLWDQIETAIRALQDINMRIRYFSKPVVIAPAGLALGGGAEIIMHGSRVVAAAELYTGLVELGAGLIPAGGGTKEALRRILNPGVQSVNADPLPFLQRIFEQVGQAKVATSAAEARDMAYLTSSDRIVMNKVALIAEAKQEVLGLVAKGYTPPVPEKIYATGRDALAALRLGVYMFQQGGYISEYDAHLGKSLAYVMTGGEISAPQWVSEQTILDLERQIFLSLCGEEKTQARMWHILQTGKPLRN